MILRFSKYEGLGNDFLVIEESAGAASLANQLTSEQVTQLCDRHFGVGADGLLLVRLGGGAPAMVVLNADGSRPEMCGNGLRCVALYLVERGLVAESELVVDTDAGPHPVRVMRGQDGRPSQVRVHMRPASLEASEVLRVSSGTFIEQPLEGTNLAMTMVSMGNPHAVTFDEVSELGVLGPRIEKDPRFRAGANVGFARMRSPTALDLTVWERGVGFTLACGTGACAAAVAAVETGRSPRGQELSVTLPGGELRICVRAPGQPIEMTGPARHVFDGEVQVPQPGAPAQPAREAHG